MNDLFKDGYIFIKDFYLEEEVLKRYSLIKKYWLKKYDNQNLRYHNTGSLIDESLQYIITYPKLIELLREYEPNLMWGGGCKIATRPIREPHRDDTWRQDLPDDVFDLVNAGYNRFRVINFIAEDSGRMQQFPAASLSWPTGLHITASWKHSEAKQVIWWTT